MLVFAVLIVGLPIILPAVAIAEALHLRRKQAAARTFPCSHCGYPLGQAALAAADTA